jgi:hypothetical protein
LRWASDENLLSGRRYAASAVSRSVKTAIFARFEAILGDSRR